MTEGAEARPLLSDAAQIARRRGRVGGASLVLAGVAALIGLLALAGWWLAIPALTHVTPHVISMRPNSALGAILLGGAVVLDRWEAPPLARKLAAAVSAAVVALGMITLAEHAFDWDAGIDHVLVPGLRHEDVRMVPVTAAALSLLGLALVARRLAEGSPGRASQILAIAGIVAVAPTLLGYLYDAPGLYHVASDVPLAPNTAAAMLLLGAALLAGRPEQWLVGVITDDTVAGRTVRLLAPPAIGLPLVVGWARLLGERAGLYSTAVGTALFAVALAMLMMALLVWQALALGRTEAAVRRQADLLDQAHDAIVAWELGGRIVYWNRSAEELYGWPAADAIGLGRHELLARRPEAARQMEIALAREGRWEGEIGHATRDGREITVESRLRVVRYGGGPPLVLETVRDVGERRRAEAEREFLLESERAARTEAERAARARDDFVATVSHELRTPLNAILGWSDMLRRGLDGATAARAVEVIERNARVQAQMIEDLLDVSRIASGKLRLDVQEVDLARVCDNAVATLLPTAEAKNVLLEKVLHPRVGTLRGDAGRLSQVVWNLLSNAVKFTPAGGRVQLALRRAGWHAEIMVRDSGAGIDPAFLPHMFDRFRQADASTTRKHGGLGLGLAIVRHIVELHGGAVRAESDGEGKGSTFVVVLPLSAARPGEVTRRARGVAGEAVSLRGLRVLVVDDEADAREIVRRMLEEQDAEVRAVDSAAAALDEVPRFHPDVLLSDIGMPKQDGYQLLRALRELGPDRGGDTPAAALTAFARPEDRRLALRAGYQVHVTKPIDRLELIGAVASLAGRAAA